MLPTQIPSCIAPFRLGAMRFGPSDRWGPRSITTGNCHSPPNRGQAPDGKASTGRGAGARLHGMPRRAFRVSWRGCSWTRLNDGKTEGGGGGRDSGERERERERSHSRKHVRQYKTSPLPAAPITIPLPRVRRSTSISFAPHLHYISTLCSCTHTHTHIRTSIVHPLNLTSSHPKLRAYLATASFHP